MRVVLAEREADLMEVLWEHGPSTVGEVRDRLSVPLAYTTVLTILRNLEAKGYVRHEEEGRMHRYQPCVARNTARRSALSDLAGKLFKGSMDALLTHMISEQNLTADQLRRVQQLLEQEARKDKTQKDKK